MQLALGDGAIEAVYTCESAHKLGPVAASLDGAFVAAGAGRRKHACWQLRAVCTSSASSSWSHADGAQHAAHDGSFSYSMRTVQVALVRRARLQCFELHGASAGEHRAGYSESAHIFIWDAAKPTSPRLTLKHHKHEVRRLAFAPNGAAPPTRVCFAACLLPPSAMRTPCAWRSASGTVITGDFLVSLGCKADSHICLWDVATGALLSHHYLGKEHSDVTVSVDGKQIVAVGREAPTALATVWDLIHAQPGVVRPRSNPCVPPVHSTSQVGQGRVVKSLRSVVVCCVAPSGQSCWH